MRALLLAIPLLLMGCAAHHPKVEPPVRVSRCHWLQTGDGCSEHAMLPDTFCSCTGDV